MEPAALQIWYNLSTENISRVKAQIFDPALILDPFVQFCSTLYENSKITTKFLLIMKISASSQLRPE